MRAPATGALIAATLLALAGCADRPGDAFVCEDGTEGRAVFARDGRGGESLGIWYSPGPVGGPAVLTLTRVVSAQGSRWVGPDAEWVSQGAAARFSPPGRPATACTLTERAAARL